MSLLAPAQARVIAQAGLLSGVMTIGMITFIQNDGKDVKKSTAIDGEFLTASVGPRRCAAVPSNPVPHPRRTVHHMKMYDLPPVSAPDLPPATAAPELK